MTEKLPTAGDVIHYPYLWQREDIAGETEGRKNRPVCVAVLLPVKEVHFIYLLAITSKRPFANQVAIEIPELEMKRAGLDWDSPSWIIINEWNKDDVEESYYLDRSEAKLGALSPSFLKKVQRAFREVVVQRLGQVDRS